jgi:hypothetical protein
MAKRKSCRMMKKAAAAAIVAVMMREEFSLHLLGMQVLHILFFVIFLLIQKLFRTQHGATIKSRNFRHLHILR